MINIDRIYIMKHKAGSAFQTLLGQSPDLLIIFLPIVPEHLGSINVGRGLKVRINQH